MSDERRGPHGKGPRGTPRVVLSLNVGSSSLKAALRDPDLRVRVVLTALDRETARLTVSGTGTPVDDVPLAGGWASALRAVAGAVEDGGPAPDVVVHRIVHGSEALVAAQLADEEVVGQLRAEAHLDPLHLPRQLDVLDQARAVWPDADHVLIPDGLFHRSLPDEARELPLPPEVRAAGVRRWGFHGLAVQSVVDQLPGLGSAVVAHLGSGCSVTAVQDGVSRGTSMSLSPAGGIPSVTRSGDLDPEVVLRLVDADGRSVTGVRDVLNRRSGISGLSGGRTDVRELLAATDPAADLALRVFVRQVAMGIAAALTTLDRWDALVFTGGIGAHSEEIRERICARLLSLRPGASAATGLPSERLVATGVRVCAVPVDEEAVMDRLARALGGRAAVASGAAEAEARPTAGEVRPAGAGSTVRVLVAAASRHGGTAELAVAIADGVRRGLGEAAGVVVRRPGEVEDVSDYDAVVLGSAVYFGHWLEEARDLLLRCAVALWERPVWLFSSGPVGIPERPPEVMLDVDEEIRLARAREHRIFPGRLERNRLDRAERAMVAALRAPEGDFRSWAAAVEWGESIGTALSAERPARDLAVDA
jgi:acetate kinase